MIRSEKDIFLTVSTYLTGFSEAELHGTGMLETYYEAVTENNTLTDLRFFFERSAKILKENAGNDAQIDRLITIYLIPASAFSTMARNIITLWHTGTWGSTVVSEQGIEFAHYFRFNEVFEERAIPA